MWGVAGSGKEIEACMDDLIGQFNKVPFLITISSLEHQVSPRTE